MTETPDVAPPRYRYFSTRVLRTERVGASFARITLAGSELAGFGVGGADQRIKVLLPAPGRSVVEVPVGDDWYAAWLAAPESSRPVLRTYTVRAARPALGELDVDFVLHSPAGPAATWAQRAEPGDHLVVLGPDRPGTGRAWGVEWAPPRDAGALLLAGDETAVPAVSAVVEALPPGAVATVLLEVPRADDALELAVPAGVDVRWLAREGAAHGTLLAAAVRERAAALVGRTAVGRTAVPAAVPAGPAEDEILWDVPGEPVGAGLYAWLAGEASVVAGLRRVLVGELGVPRGSVAFMGYWRAGRAG